MWKNKNGDSFIIDLIFLNSFVLSNKKTSDSKQNEKKRNINHKIHEKMDAKNSNNKTAKKEKNKQNTHTTLFNCK